jgi:protein-tyrosine-phosphatase
MLNVRDNNNATTVLFVCIENAGRSQIAEGFFKKYTPKELSSKCKN